MSRPALVQALQSQFHAAFAMLTRAIEQCPDDLWRSATAGAPYWQIAYHAVFFGDLYLHPNLASFQPAPLHRENREFLGGPFDENGKQPAVPPVYEPMSRSDVLHYAKDCIARIDGMVAALDLDASECGFWWYTMPKLEHLFVSLRHIQHHAGQLADRLRAAHDVGVDWVAGGAQSPYR